MKRFLDIQKRHEKLILWQRYYDDNGNPLPDAEERYPHYDNYDAINVDKVADIPVDYKGVMGVPITFFDKHDRNQFRIVGATESEGKGFSNGLWYADSGIAQPVINGTRKYERILIQSVK